MKDAKLVRILVIEDNPQYIRLIKEMLSESSQPLYLVESRGKLSDGLDRLKEGYIDIILLDLGLPDSSGIKTFHQVYARVPDIPIIVLTGFGDDTFALEAVQKGAQDYLFKGHTEPDNVLRAIRYALERKKTEKQLKEARDQLEEKVEERTAELKRSNRELLEQIAERNRAEKVLRESEERLALAIKGTNVGLWDWNIRTGKMIIDERWVDILGFTLEELSPVTIKTWEKLAHPEDLIKFYESLEVHFAGEMEYYQFEARMRHKNGRWVWVLNQGKVFEWNKDGSPLRMAGTHLDITRRKLVEEELRKYRENLESIVDSRTAELERTNDHLDAEITERIRAEQQLKDSLAEKEVLLKELHHRVKNNLQLIYSLLNLQCAQIQDEESLAAFNECKNRVNSIALIHEKLYESKNLANVNFGEYVRILTSHLFESFPSQSSGVRLTINVEDLYLEVSKAIPCALIINELITNSIKYGFPGNQNQEKEGEIKVELKTSDRGKVTLIVADSGAGLPGDFDLNKTQTLGMQIINALVKKLHGTVEIDKSEGTKFIIQFQT